MRKTHCKRGHERTPENVYGKGGNCKTCSKERKRETHKANPNKRREYVRAWDKVNPGKRAEYSKRWKEKNPEKAREVYLKTLPAVREYHREWRKRNIGKTLDGRWRFQGIPMNYETYCLLLKQQNNKCAICSIDQKDLKRRLVPDHCHTTNKARDLLCEACNKGIGTFRDDPNILRSAADYMEKHL